MSSNLAKNIRNSRKPRLTRAEKADLTRKALLQAAATVVGDVGYESASIARITSLAGVANGTFYNYFESRQDLFDQLLPETGDTLLAYIRDRIDPASRGARRERQRLEAYFKFFKENPGFLRLLNEAEVYAPIAYDAHIQRFAQGYIRVLASEHEEGRLASFDEHEFEAVVFMLMGCRSYLTLLLNRSVDASPDRLVDTYMKMVGPGLWGKHFGNDA